VSHRACESTKPLRRRELLRLAGAGAVALACSLRAARAAAPRRPNVVIFLTDDQGFGDLGCHGNRQIATPNMDAFAGRAVELVQFYSSPVCSPTRASLMTGRYHLRTGVTDVFGPAMNLKPEEVTLAEALRAAGYATGLFGKWHLGDGPGLQPQDQGFDESLTFVGPAMRQYFDPTLVHNGRPAPFKGYCMDLFTDHAIDFVRRRRDGPFLLYLPANLIHTPLQVPETYIEPFSQAGIDGPTSRICGMLRSVDENFGRLLAALKELGLEDDTFLLFASDNGPCTGSVTLERHMAGLRGLKGTVYENGIRVPCFVRWPRGFAAPAKVDRIAAVIDVMPTVLDACSAPKPAGVTWDGVSLMPLLRRPDAPWPDRTLIFQWEGHPLPERGMAYAVRNQRYKLVQPVGIADRQAHIARKYADLCRAQGRGESSIQGTPRWELYDISADPGETTDLAAQMPETVEKMKREYEAWFDDVWTSWHK
jgi:arylsulfatase A-like enzyme